MKKIPHEKRDQIWVLEVEGRRRGNWKKVVKR